jgi:hypothetical protein
MSNTKQPPLRLSRAVGDRMLLGALAFAMGIFAGWGCWLGFFRSKQPVGALEIIAQFAVHDAVLAVFILCLLALVWAVAAPPGLERLLGRRATTALFAVMGAAPIVFICLWFR